MKLDSTVFGEAEPSGHNPCEAGDDLDGVRRVALAVATQRADALRAIKGRLLAGEHAEALRLMYDFFDLPLNSDVAVQNRS